MIRLRELADELGRAVEGDGDTPITGVAPLESADRGDLSFARSEQYTEQLARTRAGAVILPPGLDAGGRAAIRSPIPGLDFGRAVRCIVPPAAFEPGVHPSAQIEPGADLDASAHVGATCAIGAGATVGARSILHPGVVLGRGVEVGADCVIHARCVLREGTRVGDRVILQPGVVLGGDGYGYVRDGEGGIERFPQIGGVVVGDDVEIGANSAVDRGSLGDTTIGRGAKIDNLVQIGHNCTIGESVLIVAQVGLAGSTVLERGAIVMGQAGLAGHLTVGEGAVIGPKAGVPGDVAARTRVIGSPAREARAHHREMAALTRLPGLLRRVRDLERRLGRRRPEGGDADD